MKYSSHSSLSVCNKEAAKFSKAPEIGWIQTNTVWFRNNEIVLLFSLLVYINSFIFISFISFLHLVWLKLIIFLLLH